MCDGRLKASLVIEVDDKKHIVEILEDEIASFINEKGDY